MENSNGFLAKGLAFSVKKTVHKNSEARDYTPKFLADKLKDSTITTGGSGEVSFHIFRLCRVSR